MHIKKSSKTASICLKMELVRLNPRVCRSRGTIRETKSKDTETSVFSQNRESDLTRWLEYRASIGDL